MKSFGERDRALLDLALADLRHDLRNKASAIGGAAYFLARKIRDTDLALQPRVQSMLDLIGSEVEAIDQHLAQMARPRSATQVRWPESHGGPSAEHEPRGVALEPVELELLLELAAQQVEPVVVRVADDKVRIRLHVRSDERLARTVARKLAERARGSVETDPVEPTQLELVLPLIAAPAGSSTAS